MNSKIPSTILMRRLFIRIILIPLVLFLLLFNVISIYQSYQSVCDKMKMVQSSVSDSIETEINSAAITFSHFLFSQDAQLLNELSLYNKSRGEERYQLKKKLDSFYADLIAKTSNILSIQFYQKYGNFYYNHMNSLSYQEIMNTNLYREAQQNPNLITATLMLREEMIDYYNFERNDPVIVLGIQPLVNHKETEVELAVFISRLETMKKFGKDSGWDEDIAICLVNHDSQTVYSTDENQVNHVKEIQNHSMKTINGFPGIVKNINNTDIDLVVISKVNLWSIIFKNILLICAEIIAFILLLDFIYIYHFKKKIVNPIVLLSKKMSKVDFLSQEIVLEEDVPQEIYQMQLIYQQMIKEIQQLLKDNKKKERDRAREEVRALQYQINPHFISNTLNEMRFMAQITKTTGIEKMAEALMKMLESSFRSMDSCHTVKEEIDLLQAYNYIMGIRYADCFEVTYDISQEAQKLYLPKLLLQPVIENSITHGFENKMDLGHILIQIHCDAAYLYIVIRDNGKGFDQAEITNLDKADHLRIGFENIKKRLSLYYENDYQFEVTSEKGSFTQVKITVPIYEKLRLLK